MFIKTINIVVIISFLYFNIVWAQGGISVNKPVVPIHLPKDLGNNLQIPENLGKVKELWHSGANKTILHIQDSHANYEAQTNIAKILEHLIKGRNTPPPLIAVEGAKGGIDTKMFRRIPVLEVRDMIADYFLEKGIINGVEYYKAMSNDKNYIVCGVEDKKVYQDNVKYFKKVQETKGPVQEYVRECLAKLKNNTWTDEQKEFIDKYSKYQDDEIGLEEYAIYLSKVRKWGQSPFSYMVELIKLKKHINFDKIEQERMDILKELKVSMVQEEFTSLITDGLEYQVGNKAAVDYFLRLKELMREYNIKGYRNIQRYFRYIEIENRINRKLLFKEIRDIEGQIAANLFNNEELFNDIYRAIILKKFIELKIYREDLRYYKEHKDEFLKISNIRTFLTVFERFCNLGIRRDHILVDNMLRKMDEIGTDTAILVTGGFHTEGIMPILRKKQCSYAVISPKMLEAGDKNKYIELMLDKKNVLERILAFTGTRLAIAAALFDVPENCLGDSEIKGSIERKIDTNGILLTIDNIKKKLDDKNQPSTLDAIKGRLKKIYPKRLIDTIEDIASTGKKENAVISIKLKIDGEEKNVKIGKTDLIKGETARVDFKGGISIAYVRELPKGIVGGLKPPVSLIQPEGGLCVTGDTILPVLRSAEPQLVSHSERSEESRCNTMGSFAHSGLRMTGSSGQTKMVPIVDVKQDDYVLSLNEETQRIEPHRINGLLDMGIKPVYKLTTARGRSIKTTANHPYLTKDGWVKVSGLEEGDEIGVPRLSMFSQFIYGSFNNSRSDKEVTLFIEEVDTTFSPFKRYPFTIKGIRNNSDRTMGFNSQRFSSISSIKVVSKENGGRKSMGEYKDIFFTWMKSKFPDPFSKKRSRSFVDMEYLKVAPSANFVYRDFLCRTYFGNNACRGIEDWKFSENGYFADLIKMNKWPCINYELMHNSIPTLNRFGLFYPDAQQVLQYRGLQVELPFCGKFSSLNIESKQYQSTSSIGRSLLPQRLPVQVVHDDGLLLPVICSLSNSASNPPIKTNLQQQCKYNKLFKELSRLFSDAQVEAAEIGRSQGDILWDRIVSIDYIGYEHVYDIEVEGTHNFIGNGIFAHNTYIQQKLPSFAKEISGAIEGEVDEQTRDDVIRGSVQNETTYNIVGGKAVTHADITFISKRMLQEENLTY